MPDHAVGLGLKVVKDAAPDTSPAHARLLGLRALVDQIGREIHHLVLELRPTTPDALGLPAAAVDFHSSGLDERLPAAVETVLYRVIQEALANVLKHAAAGRVSVVVLRAAGEVSAVVGDDGRGFDADAGGHHRLGILGRRERASLVGGTLTVESVAGRGTTAIARVPLPADDPAPGVPGRRPRARP